MEKNETFKISKKNIYIGIVAIIIIAAVGYYFLVRIPEQNKQKDVIEYKRALYDSILCQYKCPLTNYTFEENKTQNLPNSDCVKACISELKTKGFVKNEFSATDLMKDNLAVDVEVIVSGCRNENIDNSTFELKSEEWIKCSIEKFERLKENYTYLQ